MFVDNVDPHQCHEYFDGVEWAKPFSKFEPYAGADISSLPNATEPWDGGFITHSQVRPDQLCWNFLMESSADFQHFSGIWVLCGTFRHYSSAVRHVHRRFSTLASGTFRTVSGNYWQKARAFRIGIIGNSQGIIGRALLAGGRVCGADMLKVLLHGHPGLEHVLRSPHVFGPHRGHVLLQNLRPAGPRGNPACWALQSAPFQLNLSTFEGLLEWSLGQSALNPISDPSNGLKPLV